MHGFIRCDAAFSKCPLRAPGERQQVCGLEPFTARGLNRMTERGKSAAEKLGQRIAHAFRHRKSGVAPGKRSFKTLAAGNFHELRLVG